jgi:hypothetical protein
MTNEPVMSALTRDSDDGRCARTVRAVNLRRAQADSHCGRFRSSPLYGGCRPICRQLPLSGYLAWILLCCAGCSRELDMSPIDCLQAKEDEEARQERICDELRSLGAACDADYGGSFPHSTITLGKQWRGGDRGVALLLQLDWIDELTLATESTDEALLKVIVFGPKLSVLHLQETAMLPQGMAEVGNLTTLVGLDLREVAVADDDWNHICRLNLLWLSIESSRDVFAGDTPKAGQLPTLFSLRISGAGISDTTMMRIARLTAVRALTLNHTSITDAGAASLSALSNLAHLDLSFNGVEGLTLGRLNGLRQLRELVLDHTQCSTEALRELSSLGTLESVSLNETPVADSGVGELATMMNLRTLSLVGTNTTDESLKRLAGIRTLLTVVDSDGDVVVFQRRWIDSGAGKFLPRWAGSRNKRLFLWTAEGRQPLEKKSDTHRSEVRVPPWRGRASVCEDAG